MNTYESVSLRFSGALIGYYYSFKNLSKLLEISAHFFGGSLPSKAPNKHFGKRGVAELWSVMWVSHGIYLNHQIHKWVSFVVHVRTPNLYIISHSPKQCLLFHLIFFAMLSSSICASMASIRPFLFTAEESLKTVTQTKELKGWIYFMMLLLLLLLPLLFWWVVSNSGLAKYRRKKKKKWGREKEKIRQLQTLICCLLRRRRGEVGFVEPNDSCPSNALAACLSVSPLIYPTTLQSIVLYHVFSTCFCALLFSHGCLLVFSLMLSISTPQHTSYFLYFNSCSCWLFLFYWLTTFFFFFPMIIQ